MFHVYILASQQNGTLYIGVTNNVAARLELHRLGHGSEFVKRYGVYSSCMSRVMPVQKSPSSAKSR